MCFGTGWHWLALVDMCSGTGWAKSVPNQKMLVWHLSKRKGWKLCLKGLHLDPTFSNLDQFGKVGGMAWSLAGHCWFFMTLAGGAHFPIRFPAWTLREMQRAILEKLGTWSGPWLYIVVFDGLGKGATFPTQVRNLNINRNAKGHLGKVGQPQTPSQTPLQTPPQTPPQTCVRILPYCVWEHKKSETQKVELGSAKSRIPFFWFGVPVGS